MDAICFKSLIEWIALPLITVLMVLILVHQAAVFWLGAPTVSTPPDVAAVMLDQIPDHFDGTIVDLGAGWGALVAAAVARFPQAHVVAVEASPIPWLVLVVSQRLFSWRTVSVLRRDLFQIPLNHADVVLCFLYPKTLERLRLKLRAELRSGAVVVSHRFAIPRWRPVRSIALKGPEKSAVLVYVKT